MDSLSRCSTRPSSRVASRASSVAASSRIHSAVPSRSPSPAVGEFNTRAVDDALLGETSEQKISVKAGALLGELSLCAQKPYSYSVVCSQDCEILVIEKNDFIRVMRDEAEKLAGERFDFFKKYLPGATDVPAHLIEPMMLCFQKQHMPKGRVILSQSVSSKRSLFLVSSGSVFLSSQDVERPCTQDMRRLGSLYRGDVFGSLEDRDIQPVSVHATASCDILVASGKNADNLPAAVRHSTKRYLASTTEGCLDDQCLVPHVRPAAALAETCRVSTPASCRSRSSSKSSTSSRSSLSSGFVQRRNSEPWNAFSRKSSLLESQLSRKTLAEIAPEKGLRRKSLSVASLPSIALLGGA